MSDESRTSNPGSNVPPRNPSGAPDMPFDPISNGTPAQSQRQRMARPVVDESENVPPPAPWESAPNTYQPPVVNSGARYAEYGTGPGSVTGIAPSNVFHDPAQEFTTEDPSAVARKMLKCVGIAAVAAVVGLLIYWIVPANVPAPKRSANMSRPTRGSNAMLPLAGR